MTTEGYLLPVREIEHFKVIGGFSDYTPPEYKEIQTRGSKRKPLPKLLELAQTEKIPLVLATAKGCINERNKKYLSDLQTIGFKNLIPPFNNYGSVVHLLYKRLRGVPFVGTPFPVKKQFRENKYRLWNPVSLTWDTPKEHKEIPYDTTLPFCCGIRIVGETFPLEKDLGPTRVIMYLGETKQNFPEYKKIVKTWGPRKVTFFLQKEVIKTNPSFIF